MRRAGGALILMLGLLAISPGPAAAEDRAEGVAFFETKIRPVLVEKCYPCHSSRAERLKGGLRLDTREGIRRGGDTGPAVEPGKPDESTLLRAIAHTEDFSGMPPKEKLPDPVIADFRRWVEMGAPDPRDTAATQPVARTEPAKSDWWSLRPVGDPRAPELTTEEAAWARTPIDAFILAGLRAKGLKPSPEADRRTLIRRVSFDLLGLPPSPGEIEAFLADGSPDAYERLVDRLLASPHHGERWARHWMDLVHFAETHGHDQDRIRPNAWPYRDYLIESFNRDTPYRRFIQEQVAADALFADEPRLTVALGMIAAGPWDESSLRDIRDDSIDRQIGFYIDRDDMVSTVFSSFASLTVHCARCHDHKFDPISQEEYYGLQAVFAGVDRAERAYDPDPKVAELRRTLEAKRKALRARAPKFMATLLDPAVQTAAACWEAKLKAARTDWNVLKPEKIESAKGTTFSGQADGSFLARGPKPLEETYTMIARPGVSRLTAIRLEVLPDDRLPSRGPGRNDNGNLHLTEFQVLCGSGLDPRAMKPVRVRRAAADFSQDGWDVAAAIDGNRQTAWGIYPRVGKPHEAVFELAEDQELLDGDSLAIRLDQTSPAGHPIGRFRLSVTSGPRPILDIPLPEAILEILAVPGPKRSTDQRRELAAFHAAQVIDRQLADLPPKRLVYAAASDFAPDASHVPPGGPRPVHLLKRGDIHKPGPAAVPGALACVAALPWRFAIADPKDELPRRAELARWLSDARNPLTYRSIVNRVWQHHFGRGIVETPSDFGRMGSPPSHPELLDWLAARFLADGTSLKELHRLIVTSATYRQETRHDPLAAEIDAGNHLLWRQNRRRLDAESVHDAILQAAGRLDRTMGGPSVRQFALSPGVHVTPVVDYTRYDWDNPGSGRRSVYRFLFRTLPDPFMDTLDEADASQLTAARSESITPLQALALLNNPFVLRMSERLARRLEGEGGDVEEQVRRAILLAFGRDATPEELAELSSYAGRHGLSNLSRLLFNSNEFLFVN
jgi:hypothetical protein